MPETEIRVEWPQCYSKFGITLSNPMVMRKWKKEDTVPKERPKQGNKGTMT